MRGNPDHPYSKGELCPKVNRFLDRVYSPERVLHPLRRVGAKGEGRFEQITWDEALAEIAARFHEIIDRDGAEAIMPYSDAGNQSLLAMGFPERFWNRLGRDARCERAICGPTVGAGVKMTQRHDEVPRPAGAPPLEADHPVGHQHPAHQPPPVADHRGGPRRRRAGRRASTRSARMTADGRRLVHPAAARHRHRLDAGDDARPDPRRPHRQAVGRRSHARLRRARPRTSPSGRPSAPPRHAASRPPTSRSWPTMYGTDPPGGHPHADRRRAPRERGDVLPHARLPAGARRRVAGPWRRAGPIDRRVDRSR